MAIEIVDLPNKKNVIFHGYATVYQRVKHRKKKNYHLVIFHIANWKIPEIN